MLILQSYHVSTSGFDSRPVGTDLSHQYGWSLEPYIRFYVSTASRVN
jgi:hypothetical protein